MAVMPDGELRLIPDIALDPRYEHTLWFDSAQEQADYFISKSTKSYTDMSYKRVGDGVIRIQGSIAFLDQMCYMMFRNTKQTNHAYGNKWFYAFVTSAKYINENTVELTYELDLIQTWLFEFRLNKCFVEREHSATDVAGDNIVPENIPVAEYLYTNPTHPEKSGYTMNDLSLVIAYNKGVFDLWGAVTELVESVPGMKKWEHMCIGGTYYGISFMSFPLTRDVVTTIQGWYSKIEFWNTVICSFTMPTMFLPDEAYLSEYNKRATMTVSRNTTFDGYEPKNNKLFTYPYTCAYLTSFRGKGNEFYFEHFAPKGEATFNVEGTLSLQPSVMAYPTNYRKMKSYLEGSVVIPSYPVCAWGEDGLTEWINNNLFRSVIGVGATAVTASVAPATTVIPALTGGQITAGDVRKNHIGLSGSARSAYVREQVGSEAMKSVVGAVNSVFDPGTVHGSATSDLLMGTDYGRRIMGFCKHLTYQSARIVDEYFSVYGYAVNRFKVPARNNRPCWNYVKTRGCTGHGFLPSSDILAICEIYDRGITFWKKDVQIGSYNFDANKLA